MSASSNKIDTDANRKDLATVIMSEASVGNLKEQQSVGFTVLNRMDRNSKTAVRAVWNAYAHNQAPTAAITTLAAQLLGGTVSDPTFGCTHYYSPRSMPKEGEPTQGYDVGGGLEQVEGLSHKTYRPSWALTFEYQQIPGVRPAYYKFYRAPGNGPVA